MSTLIEDVTPESWMADGLCRQVDPALWFPTDDMTQSPREAIRICSTCPVKARCLAFALEHLETGVWGGTTDADRRRMRKKATA